MNNTTKDALNCLMDIQDAQGLNRKKDLLYSHRNNETLKDILYFVFNPYIRTGIGWAKLNKPTYVNVPSDDNCKDWTIQGTFSYLLHNNTGRDIDINRVLVYIQETMTNIPNSLKERFTQLLKEIFTKNLKLGISITTIHKVWPNLIPGFGVQLACKWQDNLSILQGKEIFITEKLDGNRCFAHVKDHQVTFYSRSGREITGMEDVANELSRLVDGWYDGELLAKSFNETQSTIRTKGKKKDLVFNIFDYVEDNEVEKQEGWHSYVERRNYLEYIFKGVEKFQYNRIVPIISRGIFNEDFVLKTLQEYTSKGSEGLMINLNEPYQFNRTNYLLKVKNMGTVDLKIIGMHEGSGEFADTCGALTVEYKGYPVGVGSGLSKEDRIFFWNNKEEIIGRVVEVQFFEETKDQNGNLSLRFPVFKRLREEGKEVSYE